MLQTQETIQSSKIGAQISNTPSDREEDVIKSDSRMDALYVAHAHYENSVTGRLDEESEDAKADRGPRKCFTFVALAAIIIFYLLLLGVLWRTFVCDKLIFLSSATDRVVYFYIVALVILATVPTILATALTKSLFKKSHADDHTSKISDLSLFKQLIDSSSN